MSCIITYKGNKYTQEQFKEYILSNKNEFSHIIASNKNVMDSFKRKMEGIDYVFSQSPELASIGSKSQYLQYLSTIFKTSKVKDIVYHSTDQKFEEFRRGDKRDTLNDGGELGEGIYFTDSLEYAEEIIGGDYLLRVLLNITTPYIVKETEESKINRKNFKGFPLDAPNRITNLDSDFNQVEQKGFDSIYQEDSLQQIVVFEPEQIHILGSKQDIENFKNWVGKNQSNVQYQLPQGRETEEIDSFAEEAFKCK